MFVLCAVLRAASRVSLFIEVFVTCTTQRVPADSTVRVHCVTGVQVAFNAVVQCSCS